MNVGVSTGALTALAPVIAYCAVRINLGSSESMFFWQKRGGKGRR